MYCSLVCTLCKFRIWCVFMYLLYITLCILYGYCIYTVCILYMYCSLVCTLCKFRISCGVCQVVMACYGFSKYSGKLLRALFQTLISAKKSGGSRALCARRSPLGYRKNSARAQRENFFLPILTLLKRHVFIITLWTMYFVHILLA